MCSREDDGYFFALDSPLTLEEICGSDDPAADSPPPVTAAHLCCYSRVPRLESPLASRGAIRIFDYLLLLSIQDRRPATPPPFRQFYIIGPFG